MAVNVASSVKEAMSSSSMGSTHSNVKIIMTTFGTILEALPDVINFIHPFPVKTLEQCAVRIYFFHNEVGS